MKIILRAVVLLFASAGCPGQCIRAEAIADRERELRVALNKFYESVRDTDFDAIPKYSRERKALLPYGKAMQRVLIADLQSPDVSAKQKKKAIIGVGTFAESGQGLCKGILIPALIDLVQHRNRGLKSLAYYSLEEMSGEAFDPKRTLWRQWWIETGSKRYEEGCID